MRLRRGIAGDRTAESAVRARDASIDGSRIMAAKTVLIAQSSPQQAEVWRTALGSQGVAVAVITRGVPLVDLAAGASRRSSGDLLLVDLAELAAEGVTLPAFGPRLRTQRPELKLTVTLGTRFAVADAERRWACVHGATDLFPGVSPGRLERESERYLGRVLGELGCPPVDPDGLRVSLRALAREAGDTAIVGERLPAALAGRGIDLDAVAARMCGPGGVDCRDRRYRLNVYPHCFVGMEAVEWIARTYALDRATALELGEALLERGVFEHVVKQHPLRDGRFFYHFAGAVDALDAIDIDQLVARMTGPEGVAIADRRYRGRKYSACFVGQDAAAWIMRSYRLARADAVSLGQRLVDLYLVHHVVDEHDFIDGDYFYRFFTGERG